MEIEDMEKNYPIGCKIKHTIGLEGIVTGISGNKVLFKVTEDTRSYGGPCCIGEERDSNPDYGYLTVIENSPNTKSSKPAIDYSAITRSVC